MTPYTQNASAPWWQTLLVTIANAAVAGLVNHYFGTEAAAGSLLAGTAIAHALPSPNQQK